MGFIKDALKHPLDIRNKILKKAPLAQVVKKLDSKNPISKKRMEVLDKVKSLGPKKK